MNQFKPWLYPLTFLGIVALMTEGVVRGGLIPAYLLPAPSHVLSALFEYQSELTTAIGATGAATLTGLLFSFFLAQGLALLLTLSHLLRRAIFPIAVFFQTVPIIAIAPLLVIWFGYGEPTVRASAAIVSFFPILSNALVGLESARREHLELFQVLGASRWQRLFKLQVPSGLRSTFAGLKVAGGLAVVGALVGEFVGGGGLGSLIDTARTQQRVDLVFACVVLSALLGLVIVTGINWLERAVSGWRPFHES